MNWVNQAFESLRPLSNNQSRLDEMLKEWYYSGNSFDLQTTTGTCELCCHPGIRSQFEIKNKITKMELLVGSECIYKFNLSGISKNGEFISPEKTRQKVTSDKTNLIKNSKKQRALNCIIKLKELDNKTNLNSTMIVINNRSKFSPNHLYFIFTKFEANGIQYNPSDFKVSIQRKREKIQLKEFNEFSILKIKSALSPTQIEYYLKSR